MPAPEDMKDFFDKRSATYDAHMEKSVATFKEIYTLVAGPIAETDLAIEVLDIGCGTGLELEAVFRRAPNALITGIDLSSRMLNGLREKYPDRQGQIELVQASYLDHAFGESRYDYVISVMTLHHLLPEKKLALYQKVRKSLKPGGSYIEADYIVPADREQQMLERFEGLRGRYENIDDGSHHIDIPMSLETEERVLREAGFTKIRVLWNEKDAVVLAAS